MMKFGVFYEHQLPRPWTTTSEYDLLQQSLDQFQFADQLGYDYAWVVEHHFLEEYSHSSAPEVFLGAASQRTKNIRLGHGVIQLTTNQPQRVAEKVATLDLLSGGRVDLGMGEAAGPAELHPFGIRVRDKRDRWEEAVRAIIPMFTRDSWEFHGEYYDFPARNVIPKPLQKPHPPLWVACSNIRTIGDAGRWGMGALGFSFVSPEAARAWVHRYYNNLLHRQQRLTDYASNPNIAIVNGFMCAPTDEEAIAAASGWTFFIFALSYYGRKGIDAPGTGNLWREYQDWRQTEKAKQALRNGLIGSPDTIRKRLRLFEDAHVDQVILLNQAGRTTHRAICDSLELFAREVMPEFRDRQPAQEAWKADVLAGRIALEELETDQYDLYAHQNEDIVRLTPEQLKQRMAEKERAAQGAG
jgi:luciferase family oxidoreductase group 1